MRLTAKEHRIIRERVRTVLGTDASVYLFGSRVDDNARGYPAPADSRDRPRERRCIMSAAPDIYRLEFLRR